MFQFIVNFALKNRLLIVIGLIALCIVGYISLQKLNLDAFPDVTNIQVSVNTEAPGMAAEEVEKLISYPIESVMYSLPDVAEVRSVYFHPLLHPRPERACMMTMKAACIKGMACDRRAEPDQVRVSLSSKCSKSTIDYDCLTILKPP